MQNSTTNQVVITLIRHGKTKGNEEHRYIGVTDEALSLKGIEELKKQKYPQADVCFVSPMKRCLMSADLIYPNLPKQVIDSFCEMNFGIFEGKNYQDLNGDATYQAWVDANCETRIPDGEDKAGFVRRSMQGFEKMLHEISQMIESGNLTPSKENPIHVSAVVHGGTIMSILSTLKGGDFYDYHVQNGAWIQFTFDTKWK